VKKDAYGVVGNADEGDKQKLSKKRGNVFPAGGGMSAGSGFLQQSKKEGGLEDGRRKRKKSRKSKKFDLKTSIGRSRGWAGKHLTERMTSLRYLQGSIKMCRRAGADEQRPHTSGSSIERGRKLNAP